MPLKIYSAGPGQVGGGCLVFHETWVEVALNPESAWRTATKAGRKDSNKLKRPDGTWSVWFLLSRAFVLSKASIKASKREIGPADNEKEAEVQLRNAGKARAMAEDARLHAILEAMAIGEKVPTETASTNHGFVDWFEGKRKERLAANDHEFDEAVRGFVRATRGLQDGYQPDDGYPPDVLKFSRALREQASKAGRPPTKEAVRLAFGALVAAPRKKAANVRLALEEAKRDKRSGQRGPAGRNPWDGLSIFAVREERAPIVGSSETDVIDADTFTRLLERTGFSWLPGGKTGPKPK